MFRPFDNPTPGLSLPISRRAFAMAGGALASLMAACVVGVSGETLLAEAA